MTKIKEGDTIQITRPGGQFSTYKDWARDYGLTAFIAGSRVSKGDQGVVLKVAPHGSFDAFGDVVGIRLTDGKEIMMSYDAVEVVAERRLKLPLLITAKPTTPYVLTRGDAGKITLISTEGGNVYKNHVSEAQALLFLDDGTWEVVGGDSKIDLESAVDDAKARVEYHQKNLNTALASLAEEEATLANYKPSYLE